jgi:hypothetical protein
MKINKKLLSAVIAFLSATASADPYIWSLGIEAGGSDANNSDIFMLLSVSKSGFNYNQLAAGVLITIPWKYETDFCTSALGINSLSSNLSVAPTAKKGEAVLDISGCSNNLNNGFKGQSVSLQCAENGDLHSTSSGTQIIKSNGVTTSYHTNGQYAYATCTASILLTDSSENITEYSWLSPKSEFWTTILNFTRYSDTCAGSHCQDTNSSVN